MIEENKEFKSFVNNVNKKILKKNIIAALISIISTLVILTLGYYYLALNPSKVIPLKNIEYKLYQISDGRIFLAVRPTDGYRYEVLHTSTPEKSEKMTISLNRTIIKKKSTLKQYIGYSYTEINSTEELPVFKVEKIYYGDKQILDVNKNVIEASKEIEQQILECME